MAPIIEKHRAELDDVCQRFHVTRLELFGSAAGARFDQDRSDLDFLVQFEPGSAADAAKRYFGLLAALEDLFVRPVDLIESEAITNPYFLRSIEPSRTVLYAA